MAQAPRENKTRGILWMLLTLLFFISLDTLMKYLMQSYPLIQVTWARFFFATIIAIGLAGKRLPTLVISRAPKLQLVRSVLLMSTTGLFNAGIRTTALATATTVMFTSPLLVTVLSVPLLGEKVGLRRWIGVAVGFLGAMIVVRPWQSELTATGTGVLLIFCSAFFNATYQITTRKVRLDEPLTSLLYTAAAGAIVTSLMLPWGWIWPSPLGWIELMGAGVAGGVGHFCLIKAMTYAPASVVAPFSYTSLIWATILGFLIWGDFPDLWTWMGAALIIGSGLYIFHREGVRRENR
ncbi:DMT family transporter [Aestuariivirga sp.]|uniref:DMT family transporter n=1 Tax=Aestuariivirga sp. TaxID=2650926 RepID=UPI0039E2C3EE